MKTYRIEGTQKYLNDKKEIGTNLKASNILEAIENAKKFFLLHLPASIIEITKAELLNN